QDIQILRRHRRPLLLRLEQSRQPAMAHHVYRHAAVGAWVVIIAPWYYSRLSPVVDPRFSYRGEDVVATLERACREIGYPKTIRVDNGSEFISRDMDLWAYQRGVILDFSRPGKPTDNAFIEAFNSKLRSECLNAHWFLSLEDACEKLEAWRRHYNEERPHSAIGNIPPIMLANSAGETSPPDLSKAENSRPERSKVG
ncbi:MAG: integrase core domain-containing protein, partial [Erythrobacter sp.]